MKRENLEEQLFLYENGNTSLEEEKDLIDLLGQSKSSNSWFAYLRSNKKKVPKNLKSDIWASIQKREQGKRRILIGSISIAASLILALLLALPNYFQPKEQMSYEEKAYAIEEALAMISDASDEPVLGDIIYEDEIVIIYIK